MRREELYLLDIQEATRAIQLFIKDIDKTEFLSSDLLQSAVLQKFMVIGEAASKVSNELKGRHPEIDWKAIVGFRNILVHVYFSANLEIVWLAATGRTKTLRSQITAILAQEYPDFKPDTDS